MKRVLGVLALAGAVGLAGCGRETATSVTAPDLRAHPELAAGSVGGRFQTDEGREVVDRRGVALGPMAVAAGPQPDVHIVTWPYKTTILKHVKATTDYTDPDGTHWYHIKSGWFKTRYYFVPRVITAAPTPIDGTDETFPYDTYEGELLLPIVDATGH